MTYSDMLVRIDWNDRISAEENARRTENLVASLGDRILQSTVMAGVQQFVLSHTEENGVAEATVYLKCHEPDDVAPFRMPSAAIWRRTPLRPAVRSAFRATYST